MHKITRYNPTKLVGKLKHRQWTARRILSHVDSCGAGERLDSYLAVKVGSRGNAQRLIDAGRVRIDGCVVKKVSRRVRSGDAVNVVLPPAQSTRMLPERIPLHILFEDSDILVVNKPKGMVVHPAPGNTSGTLVQALLYHCGESLSTMGGTLRPGIVHRLDKDTSGALIVAKNDQAHLHLATQIKAHAVRRVYIALVHGVPPREGTINAPIGRHPVHRLQMAVVPSGKPAVTHFRVLEHLGIYSLVEARLETGRTHQIRVHLSHAGYPVVGDPLYGPRKPHLFLDGQALHAWYISFTHPTLGVGMTCVADMPEAFITVLHHLRLDAAPSHKL